MSVLLKKINKTIKRFDISNEELEVQLNEVVAGLNLDQLLLDQVNINFDLQIGEIVKGRVVLLRDDFVIVDIGQKSEGFLPYTEDSHVNEDLDYGDETHFIVTKIDENGTIHLSRKNVELLLHQREVLKLLKVGDRIVGRLAELTPNGWMLEFNRVRALLPTQSEFLLGEPEDLLNQEVEAEIEQIEGDQVILTRKAFANEVKKLAKNYFISTLEVGHVVDGVIKNITDFGLFIQVASGIIGLCHASDRGEEAPFVGQKVKARVLKIDREKNRVSLGIRQVNEPSWADLVKKYGVDQKVAGVVKSIVPYGVFIEIEPGVTGLVHVSDLSWSDHIKHPREILVEGERVEAVILGMDVEKQHLSLGVKQITADPWETLTDRIVVGSVLDARVTNKTKFGIFLELEKGVEGLAHHTLNSKKLKVGDVASVSILRIDSARKKISLALND